MNATELAKVMYEAKREIDDAMTEWLKRIDQDAIADEEARLAKARAYVAVKEQQPKATVALLEAMVDLETSHAQRLARHAEGLRRAAQAAHDSKVRWLSTLQSLASAQRAEAQLARWEPSEVA